MSFVNIVNTAQLHKWKRRSCVQLCYALTYFDFLGTKMFVSYVWIETQREQHQSFQKLRQKLIDFHRKKNFNRVTHKRRSSTLSVIPSKPKATYLNPMLIKNWASFIKDFKHLQLSLNDTISIQHCFTKIIFH